MTRTPPTPSPQPKPSARNRLNQKGEEPSKPARIPVRWHGSIRLSTDASGVGTDPFDDADLDADPVVPGEDGDIALDYDGILELGDGVAFGRWSSGGKPSREDCLRRTTSHPTTEAELAAGSYVCALSDQERPVRLEVPDGVVAGSDTRAVELVITTWER